MERIYVIFAENRRTKEREYMRDFNGELSPCTEEEAEIFLNQKQTKLHATAVEWGYCKVEEAA